MLCVDSNESADADDIIIVEAPRRLVQPLTDPMLEIPRLQNAQPAMDNLPSTARRLNP